MLIKCATENAQELNTHIELTAKNDYKTVWEGRSDHYNIHEDNQSTNKV